MIAIETNILVYAHRRDMEHHERAKLAVKTLVEGEHYWALPWPCVHEFYRVVTEPRYFKLPSSPEVAFLQIEALLASPRASVIGESEFHLETLKGLAFAAKLKGATIHDARIASICLDNGVDELWTADRDFSNFPKLKTRNPLVG